MPQNGVFMRMSTACCDELFEFRRFRVDQYVEVPRASVDLCVHALIAADDPEDEGERVRRIGRGRPERVQLGQRVDDSLVKRLAGHESECTHNCVLLGEPESWTLRLMVGLDRLTAPAGSARAGAGGRLDRWSRYSPLTGPLFAVLVMVGGPLLAGNAPGTNAGGAEVIAFYTAHRTRERAGAIVLAFAFVAFLFFAASLRARWRAHPRAEALSALLLACATVHVVGQTAESGITYSLTDAPTHLTRSSAQTLNVLANDVVITTAVGAFAFGLVAGLAILRGVGLPRSLGWISIVLGVLWVTPLEAVGFFGLVAWVVVTSLLVTRQIVAADREVAVPLSVRSNLQGGG